MLIDKVKFYQYFFLIIITFMMVFNGGNNNLYIQINFIIISIFFLFIIKEKNYLAHIKNLFLRNKTPVTLFTIFIIFLIFQITPLPIEWISFFSPEKYDILEKLEFKGSFKSISLSLTNSYFSLLNYITLFLYLIIFKSLFYRKKDIFRFYYFLVFLGAFAASVAIYFYLIGNPDFLIINNKWSKNAASGFFINITVFASFLVLCFLSGIEYLKKVDYYRKNDPNNFFNKINIRIFILLITIGIITSFSRVGNFLFISLILIYILQALYINDKKNRLFLITLILIVLFDILILGFYFGSERLVQRYSFLQNELSEYLPTSKEFSLTRGGLVKFAFIEFKKFAFFGYGAGGFEFLFKISFKNLSTNYASHAHSSLIQYIGEFGLIGCIFILSSILFLFINKNFFSFKNFLLCYLLIFILIFDFSFHIPLIQLIFILLLSINYEQVNKFENKFENKF